ncbi:MAG: DUF4430 domain-containing protein [Oscillospiraceae bacterium]|nr:DUF4430 domain-containing protein [Oscillospiraceae bacterium]
MKKIGKIIGFLLMMAILIGMTGPIDWTGERRVVEEIVIIEFPTLEWEVIELPIEEPEVAELGRITMSLRIEGIDTNLYYNATFSFEFTGYATVLDLLNAVNEANSALGVIIYGAKDDEDNGEDEYDEDDETGTDNEADADDIDDTDKVEQRVIEIAGIAEKDFPEGSGWAFLINGFRPQYGISGQALQDSDEVIFYFRGPPEIGMQYPIADLRRLISDGILRFICMEPVFMLNDAGIWVQAMGATPVVGALVTHNGSVSVTDANGEIFVGHNNRRAGFHTLQIERYDRESGLPTVLRFAPGFSAFALFADTPVGAWYLDAVMFSVREGFFGGVGENRFAPTSRMRIEQLITVLARIYGADIDEDAMPWYASAVEWAVKTGVIREAEFESGAYVTRERFIYMFFRTISLLEGGGMTPRADISEAVDYSGIDRRYIDAISWAVASGIIRGTGEDRLAIDPVVEVSRAVASQMIYNYFNYIREGGYD